MTYSYNESVQHQQKLRLLFFPSVLGLVAETFLAIVILFALNLSNIQASLVNDIGGKHTLQNPLSYTQDLFQRALDTLSSYHWTSQATLFILWAVAGMLVYLLCFRIIQFTSRTVHALREGAVYVRTEHTRGLMKWLASLHDFFMKISLTGGGLLLVIGGAFLAFTYANLELHIGFSSTYNNYLDKLSLLIGFVSAVVGMRLIIIGLCFAVPLFRRLYFDKSGV